MSPNQASLATVRQFQSETDAIREAAEPLVARATLYVLAAFLASIIAVLCLTRLDRVISSVGGKIVPADQISVLQALDPSIIKTIDVREGEQVQLGSFWLPWIRLLRLPTSTSIGCRLPASKLRSRVIRPN